MSLLFLVMTYMIKKCYLTLFKILSNIDYYTVKYSMYKLNL